jgi:hypothetical protein
VCEIIGDVAEADSPGRTLYLDLEGLSAGTKLTVLFVRRFDEEACGLVVDNESILSAHTKSRKSYFCCPMTAMFMVFFRRHRMDLM